VAVPALIPAALVALALSAVPARAEFHGGGVLFGFSEVCAGWAGAGAGQRAVRVRHSPAEDAGRPPSGLTIAFGTGTEHLTRWGPYLADGQFRGMTGRQTWSRFAFYRSEPRMRVVEHQVLARLDPAGPATVPNARELFLRLRIQNFANLPGCAVTLGAVLHRVN